jgi:hypothetical protein
VKIDKIAMLTSLQEREKGPLNIRKHDYGEKQRKKKAYIRCNDSLHHKQDGDFLMKKQLLSTKQ